MSKSGADHEKGLASVHVRPKEDEEHAPDKVLVGRFGALGHKILGPLFKAGVEARGVERVPEDERSPKNTWNNLLMWFVSARFVSRYRAFN
jgi:hypothetical protein